MASTDALSETSSSGDAAGLRPATWIAWLDADRIVVATATGRVMVTNVNPEAWRQRFTDLHDLQDPAAVLGHPVQH